MPGAYSPRTRASLRDAATALPGLLVLLCALATFLAALAAFSGALGALFGG